MQICFIQNNLYNAKGIIDRLIKEFYTYLKKEHTEPYIVTSKR